MGELTMILVHMIDGVLLLAMMALMFFTIRLILNSPPFLEWMKKQEGKKQAGKEAETLSRRKHSLPEKQEKTER